jgi:hypothetical protein
MSKLNKVYFDGDIASWCKMGFKESSSSPTGAAKEFYFKNSSGAYELLTNLDVPEGVTSIPAGAFNNDKITSVKIPKSLTEIGGQAFGKCSSIERVDISDLLSWIAIDFYWSSTVTDCKNSNPAAKSGGKLYLNGELITSLNLKDGENIRGSAFCNNADIKSLIVGAVSIGVCAFYESGLETIDITKATALESYAFSGCKNLTSINLNGTTFNTLKTAVFRNCSALTNVTVPSNIVEIQSQCFDNCSSLTTARVGNGITKIATNAFTKCTALTDIYIDKPEGSVSGAPWGAPNSPTIHWNTPLPTEED